MAHDGDKELVARFLRGELSDEEEKALRRRVADEPELQVLLSDFAVLEAHLSSRAQSQNESAVHGALAWPRPWHLMAALSVLFAIGALVSSIHTRYDNEPLGARPAERLPLGASLSLDWREPVSSGPQTPAIWLSEDVNAGEESLQALLNRGARQKVHRVALTQAKNETPLELWNLAVVQEALALRALAAESFRKVAIAESDPVIAQEAQGRAEILQGALDQEGQMFKEARQAGQELILNQTPFPAELAKRFPGELRLYLYDALRSARSPYELGLLDPSIALLPSEQAAVLRGEQKTTLRLLDSAPYVALAVRYRTSLAEPSREGLLELSSEAEGLNAHSMAIGALVRSRRPLTASATVEQHARDRGDTWLEVLAAKLRMKRAFLDGELEAHWDEFLDVAHKAKPLYRRAGFALWLAHYADELRRLDLSRQLIRDISARSNQLSWTRARFYFQLEARLALADGRLAEARDFATEAILRSDSCGTKASPRDVLATIAALQGDHNELLRIVRSSDSCPKVWSLRMLSEVRKLTPRPPPEDLRAWWYTAIEDRLNEAALSEMDRSAFELERQLFRLGLDAGTTQETLERLRSIPEGRDQEYARESRLETARVIALESLRAKSPAEAAAGAAAALGLDLRDCLVFSDASLPIMLVHRGSSSKVVDTWDVVEASLAGCDEVGLVPLSDGLRLPDSSFKLPWSILSPRRASVVDATGSGINLSVVDPTPPINARLAPLPPYPAERGRGTAVLSGVAATPSEVLSRLPESATVLVFAHGVDDGAGQERTSIALAPDRNGDYRLDASEIMSKTMRSDASVFLAVCQSARTEVDGVRKATLPQAFAWAGARTVVAALGPIPVDEGSKLFRELSTELAQGTSPSLALHQAKQAKNGQVPTWLEDMVVFTTEGRGN
ncbi:MAG: CHAT domain-containing protein [Myxococcota bacterium]